MTKLSEMPTKPPKIITFGPLGTGKTLFAQSAGEAIQILDLDDGYVTGRQWKDEHTANRQQCDVETFIDETPGKSTAWPKFQLHIQRMALSVKKGTWPYPVVAIDSLTSMGELALRHVMCSAGRLEGGIMGKVEQQHWGMCFQLMESILTIMRSMNIAVILIAHDDMREIGGIKERILACNGQKLPFKIPRLFDEVWYFKKVTDKTKEAGVRIDIQSTPTPLLNVRTRNQIPKCTVDAGLPKLMKFMGYDLEEKLQEYKDRNSK